MYLESADAHLIIPNQPDRDVKMGLSYPFTSKPV
ncbi:BnaC03g69680D [Brassica napus]|uniref:BnaC03g69680D protein n=1 Tax=Brassica napus TaxID=3708 RepID=A0A078GKM8_BRANA|nr:BnaC03g69680D [Brassica napus]